MEAFGDQGRYGSILGLSGNGAAMAIVKASHKRGLAVEESLGDLVTPPDFQRLTAERCPTGTQFEGGFNRFAVVSNPAEQLSC
jgi:hypothetical protein